MIKQSQSQRSLQRLSPQQIQIMKLLQVPTALLEDRIKDEMEENPALEYGADGDVDEYGLSTNNEDDADYSALDEGSIELADDGADKIDLDDYLRHEDEGYQNGAYDYSSAGNDDDAPSPTAWLLLEDSFHEYLIGQVRDLGFDERRNEIADQIIGSIDDDGYLRREVPSLVDDLAFARNISTNVAEVQSILDRIQTFDPPGVGAWTLQECLILQLKRFSQTPDVKAAIKVLDRFFDEFTRKNYSRIQKYLELDDEAFRQVISVITKLTPRPGAAFGSISRAETYILPDFFVYNNGGKLEVSLNSKNAPDLRISDGYREMMQAYDRSDKKNKVQREALSFIKQKLDSARWFIDAIRQRQHTLLQTMQAIINIQHAFFITGDESSLRPMVLRDVAEATGLDISTISRTSNSKYVQTEFGTYKLKFFFSESMHTDTGEEVSSREIKSSLMSFVAEEDKHHPLSDDTLTEMLREKGYNVARRTVAKYREGLNIPVARLRKEL